MPKEFSGTNKAGRKYSKLKEKRRTPSRKRQVARGKGSPTNTESAIVRQARRDMGHGRERKDWGQ